jgi:hypothetical protein
MTTAAPHYEHGYTTEATLFVALGIRLRWDSWNMTAVTQKCTACPALAAAALEA